MRKSIALILLTLCVGGCFMIEAKPLPTSTKDCDCKPACECKKCDCPAVVKAPCCCDK